MSKKAIAKFEEIVITATDITKYLCPKATEKEVYMALNIIKSYQLNPFKREVHIIKYGDSPAQVIVGYELYLKRAERTGQLNGWEATSDGETATCTIHRKDWDKPFVWTISKAEFDKGQASWKSMPEFMLKKVAIAQAFRLAFPDELGGMPYIKEEVDTFLPQPSKPEVNQPQEIKTEAPPAEEQNEIPTIDNLADFNAQSDGQKFNIIGTIVEWIDTKEDGLPLLTKTKKPMTEYIVELADNKEIVINKMGTASKDIIVGEKVLITCQSFRILGNKPYYWLEEMTKVEE